MFKVRGLRLVGREAFNQKITDLDFIKKFKSHSNLTQEETIQLGRELNKRLAKRKLIEAKTTLKN